MDRLRDMFDHPHILIVRGRLSHASCHKVANGRHSVVEIERKRYWGTPYVASQRERFSSGEPRHVVGVEKGEATLVLLGLLGS